MSEGGDHRSLELQGDNFIITLTGRLSDIQSICIQINSEEIREYETSLPVISGQDQPNIRLRIRRMSTSSTTVEDNQESGEDVIEDFTATGVDSVEQ